MNKLELFEKIYNPGVKISYINRSAKQLEQGRNRFSVSIRFFDTKGAGDMIASAYPGVTGLAAQRKAVSISNVVGNAIKAQVNKERYDNFIVECLKKVNGIWPVEKGAAPSKDQLAKWEASCTQALLGGMILPEDAEYRDIVEQLINEGKI